MDDTLTAWQVGYLKGVRSGMRPADALAQVGIGLQEFSDARINNSAFQAAVQLAEGGVGATEITVPDLLRLREAQVSESRCAAWFGMRTDEFKAAIDKDEKLKIAYELGPDRGKANILVAQYDRAICGDGNVLKAWGENHLEQSSVTKTEITVQTVDKTIAELRAMLDQRGVTAKLSAPDVIDGKFSEMETEEEKE